jgi:hypothetical protein
VCISMLHTKPSTTKHVRKECLLHRGLNVGSDVGYTAFYFVQIVWVTAVGIVFNVDL